MSQSLLEKQKQSLAKWPSISLRYAADIRNSNVDKKSYENGAPVKLCNYTDVYYNEKITSALSFMRATATQNELERFQLREGDVIITKDSESWDDIGVPACVDEPLPNVVCGYHLCLLRPKSEVLNGRYLLRALQSGGIREKLWLASRGVTRFGLGLDGIRDLQLPLPPLPTQKAIANFLDRKTAAIDALIEKKEKLLELLAEKRSALINQAVTKGLDPNVPMKDSGIPWIGEIPGHWEVKALKRLSNFVTSGPRGWGQYYSETGPFFLRIGNVSRDRIDLLLGELQSVSPPSNTEGLRTRTKSGDILVSITADIGSVGIVPDDLAEAYVSQHLALVRPEVGKVIPRFLAYAARGPWAKYHFGSLMQGGTKVGLTLDDVRNLKVGLPPRPEQLAIQSFLDKNLRHSFELSSRISKQMVALTEYRQSLTTAAVTGQLEIPIEPSAGQDYE